MSDDQRNSMNIFGRIELSDRFEPYTLILIAIFAFILRVNMMNFEGFQHDEVFSITIAMLPGSVLLNTVAEDLVHPPFYYLLLKIWLLIIGSSETTARLLSVVLSSFTVVLIYYLNRGLFNKNVALISAVLITISDMQIYYSRVARMYALFTLLSVLSVWSMIYALKKSSSKLRWVLYLGSSFMLIYTHYFSWFVIIAENIYVFLSDRNRLAKHPWINTQAIIIMAFIPWAVIVTDVYLDKGLDQNLGWIQKPSFNDVISLICRFNGWLPHEDSARWGLILWSFPVVGFLFRLIKRKEFPVYNNMVLIFSLFCFPILFAFLGSQFPASSAFWGERYLIISSLYYYTIVALGISFTRPKVLSTFVLVAIAFWSMSALYTSSQYHRTLHWPSIASHILKYSNEGPIIFTDTPFIGKPLEHVLKYKAKIFLITGTGNNDDVFQDQVWLIYRPISQNKIGGFLTTVMQNYDIVRREEFRVSNHPGGMLVLLNLHRKSLY